MLAIFLAFVLSAGLHAQTFTWNSQYNFHVIEQPDGSSFGSPPNSDPVPVLSMDCLAANGYGQWTLNSTDATGFGKGWYLLENALRQPSLSFSSSVSDNEPGCIPPGVVQNGDLGTFNATEPKATADLDGYINFVSPNSTDRTTSNVLYYGPSDIDLSAGFCTTGPDIGSMDLISNGIHTATVSTLDVGALAHPVIAETDYRNEFDPTSDAHYLYVVWESLNTTNHTTVEIWANYIQLGSSSVGTAFFVGDGTYPTIACDARNNRTGTYTGLYDIAYIHLGLPVGWTFSNTTGTLLYTNSTFTPPFFYACDDCTPTIITSTTHVRAVVSEIAGQTTTYHGMYVIAHPSGSEGGDPSKECLFLYPNLSTTSSPLYYCDGSLMPSCDDIFNNFDIIPPVYSPLADGADVVDEPITAFCNPYDNQNGYGYEGFHCVYRTNAMKLDYSTDEYSLPCSPLLIMRAWYNGSTYPSTTTDTRLVLNQSNTYITGGGDGDPALLPDPKDHYVAAVNQMGIYVHWRTSVTIGSITTNTHYYARDRNRTFDEPIEENTLVTDVCQVTDGTSHGGTPGAELQAGKKMLIWTDPNYGVDLGNTNSGLYQPADPTQSDGVHTPPIDAWWANLVDIVTHEVVPPVGTLQIGKLFDTTQVDNDLQTNVTLTIGDGTTPGATLTVMPNFYIIFSPWSQSNVDYCPTCSPNFEESLVVKGNSTLDYYGIWGRRSSYTLPSNPWADLTFGSAEFTNVPGDRQGEGLIDLEGTENNLANLIVHGGADFHIGDDGYFTSNYGNISILNEPNIFPLLASGTNPSASGIMTFEGQATISNSFVSSARGEYSYSSPVPSRSGNEIIHVPGSFDYYNDGYGEYGDLTKGPGTPYARPNGAFKSSHTTYTNTYISGGSTDPYSLGVILFDQMPLADPIDATRDYFGYEDVSSAHDHYNNVEITAIDPQNTFNLPDNIFDVTNGTFNTPAYKTIDIERITPVSSPYYGKNILISSNYFYGISHEGHKGYFVYASGLQSTVSTTDSLSKLTVESNNFYIAPDGVLADIDFKQSDGLITSNTITGGFNDGIRIDGYSGETYDLTLICSNSITGASGGENNYGMETSDYQGYIMLDEVSNNIYYGWWNRINGGPPHLFCSKIHDCLTNGVKVDATVDLSGLHHPGGAEDVAGFNQVHANSGAQIAITSTTGHPNVWVNEYYNGSAWSTSTAGQNNIFSDGGGTVLIQGDGFSNINPSTPYIDISNNYWGSGIDPVSSTPSTYWPNFNFSASTAASLQSTPPSVSCTGDDIIIKGKGANPQSILQGDSCADAIGAAYEWFQNTMNYGPAYDTMKWYISHCYRTADAGMTWSTFGGTVDSVNKTLAGRTDVSNFTLYALGLRNDNDWFCLGVPFLGEKYISPNGSIDYPSQCAIWQYLIENPRCAGNYSNDSGEYYILREVQENIWSDTARVGDVFDSTIPTLHQLGLDTLLKINAAADVHYDIAGSQIIGNASIMPNPTVGQATVSLSIEREAWVHIEVYDLLGAKVNGIGSEGAFETGDYTTPLDLHNLPSGAYYIRISTANNEVKTLKVVKE